MRLKKHIIIPAILSVILVFCSEPAARNSDWEKTAEQWSLSWSDEFEGSGEPDTSKWERPEYNRRANPQGPDGWWLKDDAYLDGDGHLVIRARKLEDMNGDGDPFDYSSGAVRSRGRFEQAFGRFEIRAQLPTQEGWWVAFWLFSASVGQVDGSGEDGTEIDIMEAFGWTDAVNHALHWDLSADGAESESFRTDVAGIRTGFHQFGLEWTAEEYIFYIDGMESWRSSAGGVSRVPEYLKITGEISTLANHIGNWWAGNPDRSTFPDQFLVDWVRVYSRRPEN